MDQRSFQRAIQSALVERGFRPLHETAAVILLASPQHPDVLVRIGVTRVIAERDQEERYRAPLRDFDLEAMLSSVSP